MLLYGQVVEALFDKEADDAIGVENEVGALRVLVTDHAAWRVFVSALVLK